MIKILFLLFACFYQINSLKLCVIGASSALGREIIYQGINDFNYNIIAYYYYYITSIIPAAPCPVPTHIVTIPYFKFFAFISCMS